MGQEPTHTRNGKLTCDLDNECFIWTAPTLKFENIYKDHGFIAVEFTSFIAISCYFSPNRPTEDFEDYLNNLQTYVRNSKKEIVLAGDVNAKSSVFESQTQNRKGTILEEYLITQNLTSVNSGSTYTFSNANGNSIIDITAATSTLNSHITEWRVIEDTDSLSGHRYITYNINEQRTLIKNSKNNNHL